jgi:hypothetical protein
MPLMRWMLCMALSLLCLCLSGCRMLFGDTSASCDSDMVSIVRLVPPDGAEIQEERCSTGINPTQNIRFTIAPDQLQAVQDSVQVTDWQENSPDPHGFEAEAASMTSYLYGQYGDGIVYIEVLIDTSNPERYTVYYSGSYVD